MNLDIISRLIVAVLMIPTIYVGIKQFKIKRDYLLKFGLLTTSVGWFSYSLITAYAINYRNAHHTSLKWISTVTGFIILLMALIHLFNYFGDRLIEWIKRIK